MPRQRAASRKFDTQKNSQSSNGLIFCKFSFSLNRIVVLCFNSIKGQEVCFYEVNDYALEEESKYDGFYAVCTNLDDDPAEIARINHDRWEIEESFRIMKSEFDTRPVYLHRDDRIKAHFLTCFISLMIYSIFHEKYIKAANAVTVCICGDF